MEQGITSWKESMSFGCFISAPSNTGLSAVVLWNRRNYELERNDVLWLFYFCTIKYEFGGCGPGNYDLERVYILWLFYFCSSAKLNATVMVDRILNFDVDPRC